ncbi:hypothetical protein [Halorussus litoreus]|uniref:hypothetical protein n=1 Tax=Halorussus litoreus TaxID=1710536 RepID=UPI001E600DA0|nr:hypothetical protein [Halorussus litoreus]
MQRTDEDEPGAVTFESLADESGLGVVDPIARHRYSFSTPTAVSPTPVDPDRFRLPVDAAVEITAESLTLPTVVATYVRDSSGEMLAEAEHFAYEEFPEDAYSIELCTPVKCYLRVESAVTVTADATRMTISFESPTEIRVGARSHHDRPAATVTTTSDPADVMAAVSTFGSALKTTSAERSYPTLRGHPPTVELGEELHVPDRVAPPDTGVRIELPPEYGSIYAAAPLAYYLGARLEPAVDPDAGDEPRLVTDAGFEHSLASPRGFEAEVERVLKQAFFLDCVTRTEGRYEVDLHERHAIEPAVDLDFEALYDASLAERLEAYLSVPYSVLDDHVPEWRRTAHVAPTPDSVELLPFVVEDLSVVRSPVAETLPESSVQATAVDTFLRERAGEFTRSSSESSRSASEASGGADASANAPADSATGSPNDSFVQPETTDSLGQTWIGDGMPVGASKATPAAFEHRLDRTPVAGDVHITVVCNDAGMDAERDVVEESYGARADLPFDVSLRRDVTTAELRDILDSEREFLHYIGHIDDDGFECADGRLDATTLETVSVDAFLLNACQSYQQGMALVEAGSIGGVVTLDEVINTGAVRIGRAMARLLNRGFPLQAALDVARDESIVGGQYIVVGDGGLAIAQAESGTPNVCEIEREGEAFRIDVSTYPTDQRGLGSMIIPYLGEADEYYLSSGAAGSFTLSRAELAEFLTLEDVPVKLDGTLRWSADVSPEDLSPEDS